MSGPTIRPGLVLGEDARPGRHTPAGDASSSILPDRASPAGPDMVTLTVYGAPGPQGSKRHVGGGVMVESSKKVKPWREAVKAAALANGLTPAILGPVAVEITFTLPRPKHHWRTGRNAHLLRERAPAYPASPPDISKLARSTEDAITDVGIWRDDAQVAVEVLRKVYPGGHPDALDRPGAVIRIQPAPLP